MLVTLLGMVMFVNPLQPENALSPMLVMLLGIITLVNPLQPENAFFLILVIPFSNTTIRDVLLLFFQGDDMADDISPCPVTLT